VARRRQDPRELRGRQELNPADFSDEGSELDGTGSPILKHRRRGDGTPPQTWCGQEKAPEDRWAPKWNDVTCPDCHAAKEESKRNPTGSTPQPAAPEEGYEVTEMHRNLGTMVRTAAVEPLVNKALDRKNRQPMGPEASEALNEFCAASFMVMDELGWLAYLNSPLGVMVFTGINFLVLVAQTPEKPSDATKRPDSPINNGADGDGEDRASAGSGADGAADGMDRQRAS